MFAVIAKDIPVLLETLDRGLFAKLLSLAGVSEVYALDALMRASISKQHRSRKTQKAVFARGGIP